MPSAAEVISKLNLGNAKATIAASIGSPMNNLILGVHQEIIDKLGIKLVEYQAVASNRLKQSIVSVDESKPGVISVAMSADFYWKYVNYGVNGTVMNHGAPTWGPAPKSTLTFHDAILEWIRDTGLQAKPGQTYEQMAFVIMRFIKMYGAEPRPFFTDVVNKQLQTYLSKSISAVMKKAITIEIKEPTLKNK